MNKKATYSALILYAIIVCITCFYYPDLICDKKTCRIKRKTFMYFIVLAILIYIIMCNIQKNQVIVSCDVPPIMGGGNQMANIKYMNGGIFIPMKN